MSRFPGATSNILSIKFPTESFGNTLVAQRELFQNIAHPVPDLRSIHIDDRVRYECYHRGVNGQGGDIMKRLATCRCGLECDSFTAALTM